MCFLADGKRADIKVTDTACQFSASNDSDRFSAAAESNAPREKRAAIGVDITEFEYACVLQKEISLLRKEKGESIEGNLLVVNLRSREVGVHCESRSE